MHGLRHTHASLLLFAGVSIASVARRLGHASMTTTQKIYLHIIQELENRDVDLVMRTLWIYRCAESACPVFWKSPVRTEEITVPDR